MEARLTKRDPGARWLGWAALAAGVAVLVGQTAGVNMWSFAWTLYWIVPGLACASVAVLLGRRAAWLAIPGYALMATGLLLFSTGLTNLWASWAYAWTLVAPAAVGIGLIFYGGIAGAPAARRTGRRLAGVGAALFLAGAVICELLLGPSGQGIGAIVAMLGPALLLVVGPYLLADEGRDR
jgi:hypothetical protein